MRAQESSGTPWMCQAGSRDWRGHGAHPHLQRLQLHGIAAQPEEFLQELLLRGAKGLQLSQHLLQHLLGNHLWSGNPLEFTGDTGAGPCPAEGTSGSTRSTSGSAPGKDHGVGRDMEHLRNPQLPTLLMFPLSGMSSWLSLLSGRLHRGCCLFPIGFSQVSCRPARGVGCQKSHPSWILQLLESWTFKFLNVSFYV